MIVKVWIGGGDDGVGEGLRKALRVCVAKEDVAARLNRAKGGREGEQNMLARAVINFCGLKKQSVWRIEENWESLYRGQVAREAHIRKRGDDNERGNRQRKDHPRADEETALARVAGVLLGKSSLPPRAQDGEGGGHGGIVKACREFVEGRKADCERKDERRKMVESRKWIMVLS